MEFFEKAHALKNNDITKKESKTEEKIKKQLKQMLYGYKKSDNELIKQSENVIDDLDSASVSGFSDLNLTYTNSDNESTKATLDSSDLDSLSNLTEDDADLSSKMSHTLDFSLGKNSSETSKSAELISEIEKETASEALEGNTSSLLSENLSILCSSVESFTNSSSSSLFDVDGVLAVKIHKRLNSVHTNPKDILKREFDESSNETQYKQTLLKEAQPSLDDKHPVKPKKIKIDSPKKASLSKVMKSDVNSMKEENILSDCNIIFQNVTPSQSFVSITVKNVKTQRFDEITGNYRYPTIKNIGSDPPSTTFSTFNTTNAWKVEDVDIEEDIDSLVPELGTEINIDDVEIDLTDPDTSSQIQNECLILNDDTIQSEPITEMENSMERAESTIDRLQVYNAENSYVVVLKHPSNLFIHGKVTIKKLGGSAQVYGYNLNDTPCDVYAPFYNFAQCLRTVKRNNDYYGLFNKLTTQGLSVAEAEEIVTTLGSYDAVIVLEKLRNMTMDFVESNFNITNMYRRSTENIELSLKRPSENLCCSLYSSQPYKHLEESPNWQQAVKFGFNDQSKGIVCGGKGAGKSTFLRYYVNQLLIHGPVLVIDLDPGQCEFAVAGTISATVVNGPLLGPNFTHLRKPEIMFNVGMVSTMDNPRRYVSAVDALISRCANDERLSHMPWIVNTMGMCNTIGLKFMCFIIQCVQPTFLLQIELQAIKKNFEFRLTPNKIEELYEECRNDRLFSKMSRNDQLSYSYIISPAETYRIKTNAGTDNFTLAPRDERYLNFLAYFGELLHIHKCEDLLGITPYSVRLQDLYIATNIKIDEESITKVLNGKIVALCQHSTQSDKRGKVFRLGDKPLLCHGHGLIRGIDWEKDVVYLITPTTPNDLTMVNTVLYADWVPELRGQEKNLPEGTVVPYRTQSQYQQRQLMFAPRRRFNPLKLLKMSRSS